MGKRIFMSTFGIPESKHSMESIGSVESTKDGISKLRDVLFGSGTKPSDIVFGPTLIFSSGDAWVYGYNQEKNNVE